MFASDVARVLRDFEMQTWKLDPSNSLPCPQIKISISDFYQAQAICFLFRLSLSSSDYNISCRRQEANINQGIITISADETKTGQKVDAVFIKTLKAAVSHFSESLSQSWEPYSDVDDPSLLLEEVDEKYETALYKEAQTGTRALYNYLNSQNGNQVTITGNYCDLMVGSEIAVKGFLKYLDEVSSSLQKHLSGGY